MSSIVKGDSSTKRNGKESASAKTSASSESSVPKRNQKKSKNKSKSKKSEPEIIEDDSEPGPSSSKQSSKLETRNLATAKSKKCAKTLPKNTPGYEPDGIAWDISSCRTLNYAVTYIVIHFYI